MNTEVKMSDFFPVRITLEMFYPQGYRHGIMQAVDRFEADALSPEIKAALGPLMLKIQEGFGAELEILQIVKHLLLVTKFLDTKPKIEAA